MRSALFAGMAIAVASVGLAATATAAPVGASATAAVTPRPVTAWVTSQGDGTITPIDVATHAVGAPISVGDHGTAPYFAAGTPDGRAIYTTVFGDNTVRRIDTATGEVGPAILVGTDRTQNPIGIAITPDGKTAYVADYVYFSNDSYVTPIDLATDTPEAPITIHAPIGPLAITPDGRTAWVTELFPGAIVPINLRTRKVGKAIMTDPLPHDIAITPDGRRAYVTGYYDNDPPSVVPVDLATRTRGPSILAGTFSNNGIAINPQGTIAYVGGDGVTPIDLTTNTALPSIAPSRDEIYGVAFTPDGSTVYGARFRERLGRALMFDVAHARQRGSVAVGVEATDVVITPDQAPIAAFRVQRGPAGSETQFDASASQAVSSPIAQYHWDFGDGTSADVTTATTTHVYAEPGEYDAVLTLTDAAGSSTTRVFTGQTVSRNGSRVARRAHTVTIG